MRMIDMGIRRLYKTTDNLEFSSGPEAVNHMTSIRRSIRNRQREELKNRKIAEQVEFLKDSLSNILDQNIIQEIIENRFEIKHILKMVKI